MRGWLRDVDDVFLHLLVKPADGTGYRQMEVLDYRSGGGHLSASSGRWGWPSFVAEQALLAALGKPVLYWYSGFFSGNAGNHHDLILGELRKLLS